MPVTIRNGVVSLIFASDRSTMRSRVDQFSQPSKLFRFRELECAGKRKQQELPASSQVLCHIVNASTCKMWRPDYSQTRLIIDGARVDELKRGRVGDYQRLGAAMRPSATFVIVPIAPGRRPLNGAGMESLSQSRHAAGLWISNRHWCVLPLFLAGPTEQSAETGCAPRVERSQDADTAQSLMQPSAVSRSRRTTDERCHPSRAARPT